MWSRRFLIGCGAVFLVTLMLIAALALGVVTGERGAMRALTTLAPASGTRVPLPVAGTPDVLGTVQRYGDNTLMLMTAQGTRTIAINAQTILRRGSNAATFAELQPGVAVAVWGEPGDDRRLLVACAIVIVERWRSVM